MRKINLALMCMVMCMLPALSFARSAQQRETPIKYHPSKLHRTKARAVSGIVPSAALNLSAPSQSDGPRRITAGGTNLYGYLYTYGTHGLYEFQQTGFNLLWRDPLWDLSNYQFDSLEVSWYRNGKLCGFTPWYFGGYFYGGQTYYELDFNTGEISYTDDVEDEYMLLGQFINCAYDADEDVIYGYGTYDEDGSSALFLKTSGSDVFDYQDIKDYGYSQAGFNKQCISMCWCSADKKLYGINLNKELVTIDKATGDQTVIMNVPVTMELYVTGMAYSPVEDLFYWNCNYDQRDGTPVSELYTIDVNSKTFTKVDSYEGGESFATLMVVGNDVSSSAPKKAEFVSENFSGGSLSGTLTYKLPTTLMDGTAINGTLNWTLNANGSIMQTGSGQPGATVTVPVEVSTAGNYEFAFTVSYNGEVSAPATYTTYLGSDKPKAPAAVTLNETMIYWTKVTESVNGGYINPDDMLYYVYLNNELLGTTTMNTYAISIPKDKPMQEYTAYVIAVCNGQMSAPTYSNTILAGGPWPLPVDLTCTEENNKFLTFVNANNDDEEWESIIGWEKDNYWYSGQADSGITGDDWIVLPPIDFSDPTAYYSFSIDCRKHAGAYYPDTWLEVCYAQIPDVKFMEGNYILERFSPANRDFTTVTNPMFKMPSAGTWYIGVRCVTNANNLGCDVKRIKVEKISATPEGPAECTDVTIKPTSDTALEATVTFTLPTKTLGGDDLPADSELKAVLTCGSNTSSYTGKPGQTLTGTIPTEQGDNVVFLQTFLGDIQGASMELEVFTGVVTPGFVKNLQGEVSADMMSMTLNWDAPTAENYWEGKVDPATTWYIIGVQGGNYSQTYTTAQGQTNYTVTLPEGAPQDVYNVSVLAENIVGNNGRAMALNALMGTPLKLPMVDDFSTMGFKYQPWVSYQEANSVVYWDMMPLEDVASDWTGNKEIALVGYTYPEGQTDQSMLGMPRFSTKGQEEVTVSITYYAGAEAAMLDVLGTKYNSSNEKVFSWTVTGKDSPDEFLTATGKLPASLLEQPWVQLYLNATFNDTYKYVIITEISVTGTKDSGTLMTMDNEGSVASVNGGIEIRGYQNQAYAITDVNGILHSTGLLSGDLRRVELPAGVYIVTTGDRTRKLIVR